MHASVLRMHESIELYARDTGSLVLQAAWCYGTD
jgi:hypothetical protein